MTDARKSMSDDIRYRQKRYLIHMGIRTVCLVLAVVVPMPLPLRIVLVAGAIVLPYIAVVLANGGPEPQSAARFGGPDERGPRDGDVRREIDP